VTYEVRKHPVGFPGLGCSVRRADGKVVFSSTSYGECRDEAVRLNAGGSERVAFEPVGRRYERQPDGSMLAVIVPDTRPILV
jgi:hypothetical protein